MLPDFAIFFSFSSPSHVFRFFIEIFTLVFSAWVAWCVLCSRSLQYGTNGKKVLKYYAGKKDHLSMFNAQRQTQTLPGADPVVAPVNQTEEVQALKARICMFLAEHSLPFSLTDSIVALMEKSAASKVSLDNLVIGRSCATYSLTHGGTRWSGHGSWVVHVLHIHWHMVPLANLVMGHRSFMCYIFTDTWWH